MLREYVFVAAGSDDQAHGNAPPGAQAHSPAAGSNATLNADHRATLSACWRKHYQRLGAPARADIERITRRIQDIKVR